MSKRTYTEEQRQNDRERANRYYYNNIEHVKQYDRDNKERRKAVRAIWKANNPEYFKNYRRDNMEAVLLTSARNHAKRDGVLFSLTIEDIVIPERCPVFGMLLDRSRAIKDHGPSLDRVIPKLGYVKGNVRVISWRANRLKHNMLLEEIESLARYIREHIEYSNSTDVTMGTLNHGNEVLTH